MGKGGDAGVIRRRGSSGGLKRSASMLERLQSLADGMKHRERLRKMKVRDTAARVGPSFGATSLRSPRPAHTPCPAHFACAPLICPCSLTCWC